MDKNTKFGSLYIVATPIGNLDDISKRALDCLREADLCAAEDTRISKKLFRKYDIQTNIISYHQFSEKEKLDKFIDKLKKGKNIALISDAGTPLISDPGFLLVRTAREEKIPVIPVPGPSSLTSALSVSGIPSHEFIFKGFPPKQRKARDIFIEELFNEERTSIVFESKRNIIKFLSELSNFDPTRIVFVAREMTKLHASFYRGKLKDVLGELKSQDELLILKGEFVLIIQGRLITENDYKLNNAQKEILKILLLKKSKKETARLTSKAFGLKKNYLYEYLIKEN